MFQVVLLKEDGFQSLNFAECLRKCGNFVMVEIQFFKNVHEHYIFGHFNERIIVDHEPFEITQLFQRRWQTCYTVSVHSQHRKCHTIAELCRY